MTKSAIAAVLGESDVFDSLDEADPSVLAANENGRGVLLAVRGHPRCPG